ncbi:2974_t:CDS:2, partial [Cetraspora pellucida]
MGSRDFWKTYKVIKLGYYPPVSKFTRKISYQIPNNYEIETNLAGLTVRCKTQYQQAGNINYTISWINSYGNTVSSDSTISASNVGVKFLMDICNKPNTRISEIFLFGFDIDYLHKARMEAPNHGKHSYIELKSNSQKKKRIKLAAKDLNIQTAELFHNHQFVNLSGNNIVRLESAKLKIANTDITLDYQLKNENQKQYYSSLVQVCDKMLISRDGYRKLAAIDTNMVREYLVEQQRIDINNQMKQHLSLVLFNINEYANNIIENIDLNNTKDRNAIYRSIRSLLMVLVPVLTTSNPVVLRTGDKINIKVGGDGQNIKNFEIDMDNVSLVDKDSKDILNPFVTVVT